MRCIDGLCGDPACWYCSRRRNEEIDLYDDDDEDAHDRDRKPVDRESTQASPDNWPDTVRGIEGSTPSSLSNTKLTGGLPAKED